MPAINVAGTASLAAVPGGVAAAAAAPHAGSVPPPLGAPLPGGGPDVERLPVRATAGRPSRRTPEANEPHTPCIRCGGRASPNTLVPGPTPWFHHILLSTPMLPCTRPNHTHMTVICRRTHPSHHHKHLPGCQWPR